VVDHGYIAIYDASGKLLLRRDGFQHNRKLRSGGAYDLSAVKTIVADVKKSVQDDAKVKPVVLQSEEAKAGAAAA